MGELDPMGFSGEIRVITGNREESTMMKNRIVVFMLVALSSLLIGCLRAPTGVPGETDEADTTDTAVSIEEGSEAAEEGGEAAEEGGEAAEEGGEAAGEGGEAAEEEEEEEP